MLTSVFIVLPISYRVGSTPDPFRWKSCEGSWSIHQLQPDEGRPFAPPDLEHQVNASRPGTSSVPTCSVPNSSQIETCGTAENNWKLGSTKVTPGYWETPSSWLCKKHLSKWSKLRISLPNSRTRSVSKKRPCSSPLCAPRSFQQQQASECHPSKLGESV